MMKKLIAVILVLGLACGANAALTLVKVPTEPIGIGETVTITLHNTDGGSYSGWLEIGTPAVADFAGDPGFTPAGNPGDASRTLYWPDYGAWYEFSVTSFPPNPAIEPGDHMLIHLRGISEGSTQLNVYASDGITLVDRATISVIPEPATIALFGLAGLLLRRRG